MRVTLLCTPDALSSSRWISRELTRRGHSVDPAEPVRTFTAAADTGRTLRDSWGACPPDVVLALGWEAGLAGQVAARETPVPVVLRLPRAGRPTDSDRTRLEAALADGSACVLVPSAGELDRLVDRGIPRQLLRILPESVDRSRFPDSLTPAREEPGHRVALVGAEGAGDSELRRMLGRLPGCEAVEVQADPDDERRPELLRGVDVVVAAEDSGAEVSLVLQAMSSGLPAVALDTGVLSDLVADGVTGLLVPRVTDFPEALRSLVADPMRMQSMGLAAVDRVRARFDTAVVGPLLERLLLEVASGGEQAAAS